jgi:hypothetical protein
MSRDKGIRQFPQRMREAVGEFLSAIRTPDAKVSQHAGASALRGTNEARVVPEITPSTIFDKLTHEQLSKLTDAQIERARDAASALTEKYSRPGAEFSVVSVINDAREQKFALAFTGTKRIDLGHPGNYSDSRRTWEANAQDPGSPWFTVMVSGTAVDTRDTQTFELLDAVAVQNPAIHGELVWLLAQRADIPEGSMTAPIAKMCGGNAIPSQLQSLWDGREIGFRPAVML